MIGLVLVAALAASPSGADPLAPWRALAREPAGRTLLASARAVMSEAEPPAEDAALELPLPPAALYVTLSRGGVTRACVGQDPPASADLARAVAMLAAQVRTGDRRRPPVRRDELPNLRLTLAFAGPAEPVASPHEVDPGREGLLIEGARGRVAFLPGEARTVAWALREARRIGVIEGPAASARCYRFDVVTLSEAAPSAAFTEEPHAVP